MQAFLVRGTFRMAREWTKFAKEIAADDADAAVERLMSEFGSQHRVKRALIRVRDVTPIPLKEVQDPVVRFRVEGGA